MTIAMGIFSFCENSLLFSRVYVTCSFMCEDNNNEIIIIIIIIIIILFI